MKTITIKQLHARTGALIRRAARTPVQVTDRGEPVAVITGTKTSDREVFTQIRALRSRLRLRAGETTRDLVKAGRRL